MNGIRIVVEDGWVKISREGGSGEVWLTPDEWQWLRSHRVD